VIDLHCHVLPGLDDGVSTLEEAVELVRAAASEGVTAIAGTPHVRDDWPTTPAAMEEALERTRAAVAAAGLDVQLLPGGEVALDRLPQLDPDDLRRFSLGGSGRFLLLEIPDAGWPLALEPAVERLAAQGLTAVIAHPERNAEVQRRPDVLASARAVGALTQVTSAAIDGRLGRTQRSVAVELVRRGLADLVASDAHGPLRAYGLAAARAALGDAGTRLTAEVPAAIVRGERPASPGRPRRRLRLPGAR
jgi:protein-tyrosine phosphatase